MNWDRTNIIGGIDGTKIENVKHLIQLSNVMALDDIDQLEKTRSLRIMALIILKRRYKIPIVNLKTAITYFKLCHFKKGIKNMCNLFDGICHPTITNVDELDQLELLSLYYNLR